MLMLMKRLILLSLVLGIVCAGQCQTVDDLSSRYAVAFTDEGCIVNGYSTVDGKSDDIIFANTLLWTINTICSSGREGIYDLNISRQSFSYYLTLCKDENGAGNVYHCRAKIQVGEGRLIFAIDNITVESSVLMMKKTTAFEKLQPEKKEAHKAIVSEFEGLATSTIRQLIDFATYNTPEVITHWKEIAAGTAVVGMTADECLLALGKPTGIYESAAEAQWTYPGGRHIFLRDGLVATVI